VTYIKEILMKGMHSPNMKFLLLLIPIFAVLAISGCTGDGDGVTGNGIAILNWQPSLSAVDSNDQLELRLQIQNQGEAAARDVKAVLYGIEIDKWDVQTSSGSFGGFGNNAFNFYEIPPFDKAQNVESAPRDAIFQVTAPSLTQGTTQAYTPQIRVFYGYTTSAISSITIVNAQELKRLQDEGKTLPLSTTTTSAGPLTVTINAGKFMKARDSSSSRMFPITIDIENTGGGVLATLNGDKIQSDYLADITLIFPSRLEIECPTLNSFTNINRVFRTQTWTGGTKQGSINLFQGKTASITCTATIPQAPLASEQGDMRVILDYNYYIDRSTTVTVSGTSEVQW